MSKRLFFTEATFWRLILILCPSCFFFSNINLVSKRFACVQRSFSVILILCPSFFLRWVLFLFQATALCSIFILCPNHFFCVSNTHFFVQATFLCRSHFLPQYSFCVQGIFCVHFWFCVEALFVSNIHFVSKRNFLFITHFVSKPVLCVQCSFRVQAIFVSRNHFVSKAFFFMSDAHFVFHVFYTHFVSKPFIYCLCQTSFCVKANFSSRALTFCPSHFFFCSRLTIAQAIS